MLPQVSKALLDHLEATYPNRVPDLSTPDRVVWAAVGAQQVLSHLRSLHDTAEDMGRKQGLDEADQGPQGTDAPHYPPEF